MLTVLRKLKCIIVMPQFSRYALYAFRVMLYISRYAKRARHQLFWLDIAITCPYNRQLFNSRSIGWKTYIMALLS
jgi:hypothetical protein